MCRLQPRGRLQHGPEGMLRSDGAGPVHGNPSTILCLNVRFAEQSDTLLRLTASWKSTNPASMTAELFAKSESWVSHSIIRHDHAMARSL